MFIPTQLPASHVHWGKEEERWLYDMLHTDKSITLIDMLGRTAWGTNQWLHGKSLSRIRCLANNSYYFGEIWTSYILKTPSAFWIPAMGLRGPPVEISRPHSFLLKNYKTGSENCNLFALISVANFSNLWMLIVQNKQELFTTRNHIISSNKL